jgi:hypothetical protein
MSDVRGGNQMPKETKPFLAVWAGGLLIAATLI